MFCIYVETSLSALFNQTISGLLPKGVSDTAPPKTLTKYF